MAGFLDVIKAKHAEQLAVAPKIVPAAKPEEITNVWDYAKSHNWHSILYDAIHTFSPVAHEQLKATPIHYNSRLQTTAGKALYRPFANRLVTRIELHPVYKDMEYLSATMAARHKQTFFHECAHILALLQYGPKAWNHGMYWQHCMLTFGFDPATYYPAELRSEYKNHKEKRIDRMLDDLI